MWASAEVTEVAPWVVAAAALVSLVGAIQGLRRGALKKELLELISTTQRGSDESQNAEVQRLFTDLEGLSPISEPLSSLKLRLCDELRGDWELVWTTSAAILGLGRPGFLKPLEDGTSGMEGPGSLALYWDQPILQFLDPQAGVARNLEFTPLGCNRVDASIVPLGPGQREAFVSRLDDFLLFKQGAEEKPGGSYLPQAEGLEKTTVGVRFKTFTLFGLIPVPAPENATGILQVTYLDDDLRLSRGDRGNLFVLKKVSSELIDSQGHAAVVSLLLENKADVTHSFDEGGGQRRLTAYELAERAGHTKVATMLMSAQMAGN
eukprot:g30355.t1